MTPRHRPATVLTRLPPLRLLSAGLLPACVLLSAALGACAEAGAPAIGNNEGDATMQAADPAGPIALTQGVPWRDPETGAGIALGEVSAAGDGTTQARLSLLGAPGARGWEPGAVVRPREIFPLAGRFFELAEAGAGAPGQRAQALLRPVEDTGGIAAPAPGSLVLVEGGRARVDGRWLALAGIEGGKARLEHWPADQARSRLAGEAVTRIELADGGKLGLSGNDYRVVRVQPRAGSLLAFVEFARD